MAVLAIIPARRGSQRVPLKNQRPLGGIPLVQWVIEAAAGARRLNRVVVSSDDPTVLAIARRYDARLPLARPPELATHVAPAIEYVRHALTVLEASEPTRFDIVVILQPTSPFTSSSDIDGTIDLLLSSGADTAVSIMRVDHAVHPLKLKVLAGDRLLPFLEEERGRMAADQLPPVFVRNCSVYATRRQVIESGEIIGADCRGYLMPAERSIDINEELDFAFAEFLVARRQAPAAGSV